MSVLLFVELERQIWVPSYSALSMFGTFMNSYGTGLIQSAGLHYGNGGTGGEAEGQLMENGIGGVVVERVELNDLMAETLQCPGAIEAGVVGRDGRGVENLHDGASLIFT